MRYLIFLLAWLFVLPPSEVDVDVVDPAKGARRIESRATRQDHGKDSAHSGQQRSVFYGAWYAQMQRAGDGPGDDGRPDSSTPALASPYPAAMGFSLVAVRTVGIPAKAPPDEPVFSPARLPLPVEVGPPFLASN